MRDIGFETGFNSQLKMEKSDISMTDIGGLK
jgi:hypothetical protein